MDHHFFFLRALVTLVSKPFSLFASVFCMYEFRISHPCFLRSLARKFANEESPRMPHTTVYTTPPGPISRARLLRNKHDFGCSRLPFSRDCHSSCCARRILSLRFVRRVYVEYGADVESQLRSNSPCTCDWF